MSRVPYDADFYKKHPLTCDPDDLWGQVRRTVNGRPVSEAQIQAIVDAVRAGLELQPNDVLLDLCCGNGALSDRVFSLCAGGVGVDFSPPLIETAHARFEVPGVREYVLDTVDHWVVHAAQPERFTVALCYGSFSYLDAVAAEVVLRSLWARFSGIHRLFIGNLPDLESREQLVGGRPWAPGDEHRHDTQFGIMRSRAGFGALAASCGWDAEFRSMGAGFFAAGLRYDAVLRRVGQPHV